jgi:hypothetical protein
LADSGHAEVMYGIQLVQPEAANGQLTEDWPGSPQVANVRGWVYLATLRIVGHGSVCQGERAISGSPGRGAGLRAAAGRAWSAVVASRAAMALAGSQARMSRCRSATPPAQQTPTGVPRRGGCGPADAGSTPGAKGRPGYRQPVSKASPVCRIRAIHAVMSPLWAWRASSRHSPARRRARGR